VAVAPEKSVPVEVHGIGTVDAIQQVTVRSLAAGYMTRIHFHEGERVKAGQTLFQIDPGMY